MIHPVPNRDIYKYRNFNWGCEIISNNELFFDDPRNFPDICDCSIKLVEFNATNEDIISKINNWELNRKGKREKIQSNLKNKKKFSDVYRLEYAKMLDNIRISCFSQSPSINQLWIKYADNYKGMCLHFDSRFEVYPIIPYTVEYFDPLPKYNFFKEGEDIYIKTITAKLASKYSFEEEVRLFHSGRIKKISFDSRLLVEVILGHKISTSDIKKVRELLDRNNLKHIVLKKASFIVNDKVKIEEI